MDSLFAALKPGGRVILVDFKRIEGESSDWTLTHVRAGQEVFEAEVLKSGFVKMGENKELLKDNYFIVFQKPESQP
jgi:predicted methyltransferase